MLEVSKGIVMVMDVVIYVGDKGPGVYVGLRGRTNGMVRDPRGPSPSQRVTARVDGGVKVRYKGQGLGDRNERPYFE
jgi:hypothetical protein